MSKKTKQDRDIYQEMMNGIKETKTHRMFGKLASQQPGLHVRRLMPEAGNEREITFAIEWHDFLSRNDFEHLVPHYTERDAEVAATIIQWLGSNVGMSFLRKVVEKNIKVREELER